VLICARARAGTRRIVSGRTPGATPCYELYDMQRMAAYVASLHRAAWPTVSLADQLTSFVAFCVACGNDYSVKTANGLGRASMFDGYLAFVRGDASPGRANRQRPLATLSADCTEAHVSVRAFVDFVRTCQWARLMKAGLGKRVRNAVFVDPRVEHDYETIARFSRMSATEKSRAEPLERLVNELYPRVQWSMSYLAAGPRAFAALPATVPAPAPESSSSASSASSSKRLRT
jgi:hypothetical protein